MKNEESFLINNPNYIVSHLTLLAKSKSLITVHLGNNESFLTTLIEVSKEHNNAIIFDYGPSEAINQTVLSNNKLQFATVYQGVSVAFSGDKISKILYDGEPAFMMPLPNSIFWRELRQYYRVKSPLSKNSYCRFSLPEQEEVIELKLHDISLSGFSMRAYSSDIAELLISEAKAERLIPGQIYEKAKLVLEATGEGVVAFEIRYNDIINPEKVNKIQRIGCKFTHLSPTFEAAILRYMQQLQREELQKKD
jgi:flagellar brake protein